MCSFFREVAVSFVNRPSGCVCIGCDEVPLSVMHARTPKEPALLKGNREGKKER